KKSTERVFRRALGLASNQIGPATLNVVAFGAQVLHPTRLTLRQVETDRKSRQDTVVEVQTRIVGTIGTVGIEALVGVAKERRIVAGAPRDERQIVKVPRERRAVSDHPVVHLIH